MNKLGGTVELVFSIAIVAGILLFSGEIRDLSAYGYAGAFLIALLGSATIVLPSPAFAVIIAMSASLDPVLLGIVAGIGSGLGEITGYLAGNGARVMLNSHIKETKKIEDIVRKYDVAGIFVLSFIPNPLFDVAGIVAGGLKIHWAHFLSACVLGRVLRYVLLALIGSFTLGLVG
jgi:membrane protein YqaA with SNARE-associated domain